MKWSENEWLDFNMSIKMGLYIPNEVLIEAVTQYQLLELNQEEVSDLKETLEYEKEKHEDAIREMEDSHDDEVASLNQKYNELKEQITELQNGTLIEQYNKMEKEHERILEKNLNLENKLKDNERNVKDYKTMWQMINRKYNELEQQYYALKRQQVKKN